MLLTSVMRSIAQTKWLVLLLFTVVGAFLELAGLALFVPLLLLLLADDGVTKSEYLSRIYNSLDIGNYGTFLVLVCGAVLLFTLLNRNIVNHN